MKYSLCLSLMCAAVLYGCVEDHAIVADPCEMDSDCPGLCVNDFCAPGTDNTQGAGGAIGGDSNDGEGSDEAGSSGEAGSLSLIHI